jgi:hypothetical protein
LVPKSTVDLLANIIKIQHLKASIGKQDIYTNHYYTGIFADVDHASREYAEMLH